jgi:hypothetical protein
LRWWRQLEWLPCIVGVVGHGQRGQSARDRRKRQLAGLGHIPGFRHVAGFGDLAGIRDVHRLDAGTALRPLSFPSFRARRVPGIAASFAAMPPSSLAETL